MAITFSAPTPASPTAYVGLPNAYFAQTVQYVLDGVTGDEVVTTFNPTLPAELGLISAEWHSDSKILLLTVEPTASATWTGTVSVTDGTSTGTSAEMTVVSEPIGTIPATITADLGYLGTAYSYTPAVVWNAPLTQKFALVSGALPAGLSLDTGSGKISGTPTVAGDWSAVISLSATGVGPNRVIPIQNSTISGHVQPALALLPGSLSFLEGGKPVGSPVIIVGGHTPYTFTLTNASALTSSGLTLDANGNYTAIPNAGTYPLEITVADANGASVSIDVSLNVYTSAVTAQVSAAVGTYIGLIGDAENLTDPTILQQASTALDQATQIVCRTASPVAYDALLTQVGSEPTMFTPDKVELLKPYLRGDRFRAAQTLFAQFLNVAQKTGLPVDNHRLVRDTRQMYLVAYLRQQQRLRG